VYACKIFINPRKMKLYRKLRKLNEKGSEFLALINPLRLPTVGRVGILSYPAPATFVA
jgi:hypothetical protein